MKLKEKLNELKNKVTGGEKDSAKGHYLSAKEIRDISKANAKVMMALEKKKHRKADESEFVTEMKDNKNILEIENLHTYFFTDQGVVKAVNGVSFNIPKGSTVGIVGESGCGKTTLGRAIIRLHEPTGGKITYGDEDVVPLIEGDNFLKSDDESKELSSAGYSAVSAKDGDEVLMDINSDSDAFGDGEDDSDIEDDFDFGFDSYDDVEE